MMSKNKKRNRDKRDFWEMGYEEIAKTEKGIFPKSPFVYPLLPTCNHWRDPILIGNKVVTLSGYKMRDLYIEKFKPSFGMYLDPMWVENFDGLFSNDRNDVPNSLNLYPSWIVSWKDLSVVSVSLIHKLVRKLQKEMGKGIPDIGCLGAHGRTGTLLACLLIREEGLCAKKAIEEVRSRHCEFAIETISQEKLVEAYEYFLKRYVHN